MLPAHINRLVLTEKSPLFHIGQKPMIFHSETGQVGIKSLFNAKERRMRRELLFVPSCQRTDTYGLL